MSTTKKLCVGAICAAFCCVLPPLFHAVALGSALSPLHLPVLLCGMLCGWNYGLLCGIVGPVLSCLISGMPSFPMLITMIPELCVYGVLCGLLMNRIRTRRMIADLYLSLIPAMLAGRVVGGIVTALVYSSDARHYSLALWAGSYFVATLPGAIVQLILLPCIVLVLAKAKLIPDRYPAVQKEC